MSTSKYKHVFFDLDHTLWDFESNSIATLNELFTNYKLSERIASVDLFISNYQKINKELWSLYHQNLVDKSTLRLSRFVLALEKSDVFDLQLAIKLADDYTTIAPYKGKLFADAHEVLAYLQQKYSLHLITNGFKEVQYIKVKTSDLEKYFKNIFISEDIGFNKPQAGIFNHALNTAHTKAYESIMIGDNYEADILGAAAVGMDTILFNPEKIVDDYKTTFQIHELKDLKHIL